MTAESINRYYGQPDLSANILAALQRAGKDLNALTRNDLAPFEEFHLRGRAATMELANLAGLSEGMAVLDVGSGIGGPARTLAAEFGCQVTGLDLTEEYCRAAEMLTGRVGLSDKVTIRQGDALDMPFDDEAFDLVWMQHMAMNIEDKERLFGEIRRVLRPGERLALYEIFAGSITPLHFPVPWASDPAISFLVSPTEARQLLAAAGFRELVWTDVTGESIDVLRQLGAAAQSAPSPRVRLARPKTVSYVPSGLDRATWVKCRFTVAVDTSGGNSAMRATVLEVMPESSPLLPTFPQTRSSISLGSTWGFRSSNPLMTDPATSSMRVATRVPLAPRPKAERTASTITIFFDSIAAPPSVAPVPQGMMPAAARGPTLPNYNCCGCPFSCHPMQLSTRGRQAGMCSNWRGGGPRPIGLEACR